MSTSEIATVLAWHDAVNSNDIETLLSLSSDDIELGDPSGAEQGLAELREWATTTGMTFEPGRMFVHDGIVVVEETSTWGSAPGDPIREAVAFRVVDDRVVTVYRHASLAEAFEATGLSEADLYEG